MPDRELAIDGRFELGERVGKGAFGEVLRAVDRTTGETVAIKRLLAHQDDALILDRFEREARLLQRLNSPYIVRYVAHGPDASGRPCIALEWLDGSDLSRLLKGTATPREGSRPPVIARLPAGEAVSIVQQAALGLYALHDKGIVHRDIKPANFFVLRAEAGDEDADARRVKLIDLGIARAHSEAALTAFGTRIGTPSYMSPEQARGEEGISAASDIFSLGIVLYELLTGARPFTGDQSLIVLAKIVLHEPPRLSEVRPDLPAELAAVVARAMAKLPAARFETARAFAEALGRFAQADPRFGLFQRTAGSGAPPGSAGRGEGARAPSLDDADDDPTTAPSSALSATREQRVVTAVFAGFSMTVDPPRSMVTFQLLAIELGASCYPTLGKQMIAVFGGTRSSGDEALRGARLALAAATRIEGVQLSIATGRAHVGEAGISADAIERGARERPAGAGGIVLDVPTARLVGGQLWVEEVCASLGGAEAGSGAGYVLRGERAAIPTTGPRLLGRETTMVGRDREIGMLEALYDECVDEPIARAALIIGPPGAGKSRLRYELLRRLSTRADDDARPTVLISRAESLSAGSPYGMIADLIRRAADIVDGEPARAQERKLVRRIEQVVETADVARLADFLGELAGIPSTRLESPALRAARGDPMAMGDAKRLAFEDWILAECGRAPLVIVLEDLHWGDVPTVKLITSALETARDQPLFVLAVARPEVRELFPDLWRDRDLQECRLTALTRSASERLVREVLGDRVDRPTARLIAERAGGNAFYLEELIRAIAEGQTGLPASVLGMVQTRLDALGPGCKRVLRAASVFGERFFQGGVIALCGGQNEAGAVATALDELCAREVVARRPNANAPGKTELAFRHALLREAAYAMLEAEDRAVGHRLAGEWLETTGETDAIALAKHYELGGQPHRALGWYQRAAEQALEGNDLEAAITRADRGVACGAEGKTLGLLRLVQAEAYRWRGATDEAIRFGIEAASLLPRGDRPWFRAIAETVSASGRRGAWDDMEAWLNEVGAAEATPWAQSVQIATLCTGGSQLVQAGRLRASDAVAERIQQLSQATSRLEPFALARLAQHRAFRAFRRRELEAARDGYIEAITVLESAGNPRNACLDRINLGLVCAELGDFERAEEVLRVCIAGAERMRLHTVEAYAFLNLGRVLLDLGRFDEAAMATERARQMGLADGSPRLVGAALTHLSVLAFRQGDHARAEDHAHVAEETLSIAPPLRAGALAARARALLALGRADEALPTARAGIEIIERGQSEMFHSLVRLSYAEALRATGSEAAARAAIAAARDEILHVAGQISDAGTREQFLTRVDSNAQALALAETWGA